MKKINFGLISFVSGLLLMPVPLQFFIRTDTTPKFLFYLEITYVVYLLYFFSIVFGIGSLIVQKDDRKNVNLGLVGLILGASCFILPIVYLLIFCGLLKNNCFMPF